MKTLGKFPVQVRLSGQTVSREAELLIDVESVVKLMAHRAARGKSGKSTLADGRITLKILPEEGDQ